MQDVVLAVDKVVTVEPAGNISVDSGIGASAFNDTDKGTVFLLHAEHRERVLCFADNFGPFRGVIPAVKIRVIRALRSLPVVVPDQRPAAFRDQGIAVLVGSCRAKHGKYADIGQRGVSLAAHFAVGNLNDQVLPVQPVDYGNVEHGTVVILGSGHILLVNLVFFLSISDFFKENLDFLLVRGFCVGLDDIQRLLRGGWIKLEDLCFVFLFVKLVRFHQGVDGTDLFLALLGHGVGKLLVPFHSNCTGNQVVFLDFADRVIHPDGPVLCLRRLVGLVLDGVCVVVEFDFTAAESIGHIQRGGKRFLVGANRNRIAVPVCRIGIPGLPCFLVCYSELGRSLVHFKQQEIIFHIQRSA